MRSRSGSRDQRDACARPRARARRAARRAARRRDPGASGSAPPPRGARATVAAPDRARAARGRSERASATATHREQRDACEQRRHGVAPQQCEQASASPLGRRSRPARATRGRCVSQRTTNSAWSAAPIEPLSSGSSLVSAVMRPSPWGDLDQVDARVAGDAPQRRASRVLPPEAARELECERLAVLLEVRPRRVRVVELVERRRGGVPFEGLLRRLVERRVLGFGLARRRRHDGRGEAPASLRPAAAGSRSDPVTSRAGRSRSIRPLPGSTSQTVKVWTTRCPPARPTRAAARSGRGRASCGCSSRTPSQARRATRPARRSRRATRPRDPSAPAGARARGADCGGPRRRAAS